MRLTATLMLALLGTVACHENGVGPGRDNTNRILLTDAPFPFDQVRSVNVHIVSIAAARHFDTTQAVAWTPLAEPNRTVNLLELQNGETMVLGEGSVSALDYEAVRMVINTARSSIIMADGSPAAVNWQGPAEQTLYGRIPQLLVLWVEGTTSDFVIDFDVGRSFQMTGPGEFVFLPWIRAASEIATGTVLGVVRGANAPSEAIEPVANASIGLYYYYEGTAFTLVATGRTDAQGRFAIHYVSTGGPYLIQATPPAGFDAPDGYAGDVIVPMRGETTVDVLLGTEPPGIGDGLRLEISGPTQITVGQKVWLYGFVVTTNGDSVLVPQVTWSNGNPGVASLSGSGSVVQLTGVALGRTTVIATSGDLADTTVITVAEPGAPVASIEVLPASLTLSVGDSTGLQAVLRDAVGNVLNDRAVAWSVDSTVVNVIGQFGQYLLIRAVAPGTQVIRAMAEGKEGKATVVVN